MMDADHTEDTMRFFRKGHSCRNICLLYKAPETVSSQGVVNQYKCITCNEYLYPAGIDKNGGTKICKCCRDNLVYITKKNYDSDSQLLNQKISMPSLSQNVSDQKTYGELMEFIEGEMKLQSNYQLVMLKFLVNHKIANKGQIAEDLAYYNNKNINNIDEVKKFFSVSVYDELINKGFVKKIISNDFTEYMLNVKLDSYQPLTLNDLLESKIKNYNLEQNIPENQFGFSSNIDWMEDKSLIKKFEYETISPNFWIWSVTPENWEILKSKNIWGSKIPKDKIKLKIKSGDQVAVYVIDSNSFKGIFEFIEEWYDSPGDTWNGDIGSDGKLKYLSQIKLKPIQLGSVNVPDLYEKMELFIGKSQNNCNLLLQGGSGYQPNNGRSLSKEDFEIIKRHMTMNQPILEPEIKQTISTIVKECPKCHAKIEGLPGIGFDNQIEDIFGYRQFDPNDSGTRKPQSYCRKCRKIERESKMLEDNKTSQVFEDKSVEGNITEKDVNKLEEFLMIDSQKDDIIIKRYTIHDTYILRKNQIVTNDELMKKFGVGNMGGIRYSRKNNVLILCSTFSNNYTDEIDEDTHIIKFSGEGQIGEQTLTGGNYKIINSENMPMLFFKELYQNPGVRKRGPLDNIYTFVGKVRYVKHYWKNEDKNGNQRRIVKFLLEIES